MGQIYARVAGFLAQILNKKRIFRIDCNEKGASSSLKAALQSGYNHKVIPLQNGNSTRSKYQMPSSMSFLAKNLPTES